MYRVVREVTRYSNGDLRCVILVIKRCSWTHRPFTVINYNDLRYQGYELVPGHMELDPEFEKALGYQGCGPSKLGCCDIKGIS